MKLGPITPSSLGWSWWNDPRSDGHSGHSQLKAQDGLRFQVVEPMATPATWPRDTMADLLDVPSLGAEKRHVFLTCRKPKREKHGDSAGTWGRWSSGSVQKEVSGGPLFGEKTWLTSVLWSTFRCFGVHLREWRTTHVYIIFRILFNTI